MEDVEVVHRGRRQFTNYRASGTKTRDTRQGPTVNVKTVVYTSRCNSLDGMASPTSQGLEDIREY